jgi:hypothetical protein
MKKAIELLGQARHQLGDIVGATILDANRKSTVKDCINKALSILQAPRWETPEQREKRTGEPWPDNWPVFFEYGENTNYWQIERFGRVKNERVLKIGRICVFTEFGPPPDDWEPKGE